MSVEPSAPASATAPAEPPFFLQKLSEVTTDWDNHRRWKMEKGLPNRYEEIVRTLFAYIPSTSIANFSIATNGTVEKTESPVTYECIFTPEQIKILIELEAISGNVYADVKKAYPKPSRAHGTRNEELRKLLDVHNFDQGIITMSLHDSLLKIHKQKLWRAQQKYNKPPRSVRGAERYAASEAGSTVSLTDKMKMWRLRSNRDDDSSMDNASDVAGPSGT
ncbi:hypothetical protein C8R42DRAFT_728222 [Lentinula raphanica]|nr:hypothetical protein C8R42DRAFT_728222 [Lentinula raphanica]